jgi:hypothetical protein
LGKDWAAALSPKIQGPTITAGMKRKRVIDRMIPVRLA